MPTYLSLTQCAKPSATANVLPLLKSLISWQMLLGGWGGGGEKQYACTAEINWADSF
jgi:hypothetical protein